MNRCFQRGVRKNIGIFSSHIDDTAYVCKLLATNFKTSLRAKSYKHYVIIRNDLFSKKYDIVKDLKPQNKMVTSVNLIDDIMGI